MITLSERYEEVVNEYLDLFCKKHDVYHSGWIGGQVGGLIEISECYFRFEDIKTDIDLNALNDKNNSIWDWYWSNMDEEQQINYYSYVKGLRLENIK